MKKVTVVIPARNEEKHIANVIKNVSKCEEVDEILVVNNNSSDNTKQVALENGAKVVTCKKVGKGYAMEMGIKNATGDIILFADADIDNYDEGFVYNMIKPILKGRCDFVKSTFERQGGRVTNLVAKPLLELTFPELCKFNQPLSGIIAGRKEYFEQIVLEKDYGVDIGILIDLYKLGVRIREVNIGDIENDSQDWKNLIDMSRQVTAAIIKRAFQLKSENEEIKNEINMVNSLDY